MTPAGIKTGVPAANKNKTKKKKLVFFTAKKRSGRGLPGRLQSGETPVHGTHVPLGAASRREGRKKRKMATSRRCCIVFVVVVVVSVSALVLAFVWLLFVVVVVEKL